MLFHPANLPYWFILGIGVVLFLVVIFSGGGDDSDGDLGGDRFLEVDGEGDIDFAALKLLGWLGIGKAPLSLLLAIDFCTWGVLGWMLNIAAGTIFGGIPSKLLGAGGLILLVSLGLSLFIGSLAARPLGQIFAPFSEDVSSERLIGCVGTVISKQLPYFTEGKIGQADVLDAARNLVTVSVCLPHWALVVPSHGQEILIIDRNEHCYLAIAHHSSDSDKWLQNSHPIDSE